MAKVVVVVEILTWNNKTTMPGSVVALAGYYVVADLNIDYWELDSW